MTHQNRPKSQQKRPEMGLGKCAEMNTPVWTNSTFVTLPGFASERYLALGQFEKPLADRGGTGVYLLGTHTIFSPLDGTRPLIHSSR